jgi:hypothetical protein
MDGRDNQGQTPLSRAAGCRLKKGKLQTGLGRVEKVVEVLLENGAFQRWKMFKYQRLCRGQRCVFLKGMKRRFYCRKLIIELARIDLPQPQAEFMYISLEPGERTQLELLQTK